MPKSILSYSFLNKNNCVHYRDTIFKNYDKVKVEKLNQVCESKCVIKTNITKKPFLKTHIDQFMRKVESRKY